MKIVRKFVCCLTLSALVGCSGGMLPFSSGELDGKTTPVPQDWTDVAVAKIVQLETQPADPYSVNLWVIGQGPNLYVFAGASRSNWIEHIETDPAVRLQIDQSIFELQARRVTDKDEFRNFADAWESKYGNRPRNENVDEAYLMKLSAR